MNRPDDEATFHTLINQLTKEHHGWVHRDAGTTLMPKTGLLQQLREAVFSGMENTGGSSAFGSKPPMDTAAEDLLNEITVQASEALMAVSHAPTPFGHAESYVRLWAGQTTDYKMFTVTAKATMDGADAFVDKFVADNPGAPIPPTTFDEQIQVSAVNLARRWVERIEGFFNPPNTREIAAPCPNCGERYLHRQKDGTHVQSAALVFIRHPETNETLEARCLLCGTNWLPAQFEFLAKLVGAKPLPELAEK